jgi:hypothetical protein
MIKGQKSIQAQDRVWEGEQGNIYGDGEVPESNSGIFFPIANLQP